jgi:hypothetical protein
MLVLLGRCRASLRRFEQTGWATGEVTVCDDVKCYRIDGGAQKRKTLAGGRGRGEYSVRRGEEQGVVAGRESVGMG